MNTQHTPEPWGENSQGDAEYIYSERHGAIATIPHGGLHRDEHKANAARIVACVNACAGIHDPKELIAGAEIALIENMKLKQQLDELLKAVKSAKKLLLKTGVNIDNADVYNSLNNAIKLAEGGSHE